MRPAVGKRRHGSLVRTNEGLSRRLYQCDSVSKSSLALPGLTYLSETDRLAANDARRFSAEEVYRRLKEHAHA